MVSNVMSFKTYLLESEYDDYRAALERIIESLENGTINESLLDSLSSKMKHDLKFMREFANLVNGQLLDVLKIFKNKALFSFFNKIKWSFGELIKLVRKGYKLQKQLKQVIAEYIASTNVVDFTKDKLQDLDAFLKNHPMLKNAGILVVVGFLIYQWTEMISFTGDIEFDFDQTVLFEAIKGNFSLADLFATPDGIQMLLFIAMNVLTGVSFPWPGNTWVLFTLSIVYTVSKDKYPQIASSIIHNAKKLKSITV